MRITKKPRKILVYTSINHRKLNFVHNARLYIVLAWQHEVFPKLAILMHKLLSFTYPDCHTSNPPCREERVHPLTLS